MNHKSCASEVITRSGKFTFYRQEMSICEAKKFCARREGILAPITNKEDFDALHRAAKAGNHPGCQYHHGYAQYFIGLDVTPCGEGKQDRVFTNGEVWDDDVHGKLYLDRFDTWNEPCVFALFVNQLDGPSMGRWNDCYQGNFPFICLQPSAPRNSTMSGSKALKSSEYNDQSFFAMGLVGCLAFAAVFFAFVATKYFKKYRAVEEKHAEVKENVRLSEL